MILSLLLLQLVGLGSSYAQDEPLKVVATYSILGDVVQNIAGDTVELSVLVGADGDAHTFEPTPQDGITLAEADLIFENGVEFETWLDDLYTASGSSATRVAVSEGVELRSFEEKAHDHADEEHDHAEITNLLAWAGDWITTNRYADAPEMQAVYQVMADTAQRPIADAQAFVDRVEQADFDALRVEGDTFTYITGDNQLTCTYSVTGSQVVEFVTNPITWYLLETMDPNGCEAYHYVTAMPIHTGDFGEVPNFHIRYGNISFDDLLTNPENAYWFATVAPEEQLTLEVYVESYQASAAAYGALMLAAEGDTSLLDAMLAGGEGAEAHDHDHEEAAIEVVDLSPWGGEWNSAYRFADEAVMEPVYAAIDAVLPEMTVDEVKTFIAAMYQTDFEAFTIVDNTVTYQIGDATVVCDYTLNAVEEVTSGEYTFEVADFVVANDVIECEPFTHALFMLPHGEGAGRHYHVRYGNSDLATIMSDPDRATWYPSLYPTTLTVDELAAGLMAATNEIAAFIAQSTGQEMIVEENHDHAEEEDHAHDGHDHGEFDPHIWQNPQNVIVMTENVRDALIAADPANAEAYTANAAAYIAELQALDAEIETAVSAIPAENRKLVTSHDALGYFAARYGFEVIATVLPATTEAADPSAGDVAEIIEAIQAAGVPAVFIENVSNPDLMEQIADNAGVEVAPGLYTDALGEAGSEGSTYLEMMRYNVAVIAAALQ
jgi:ABC-type Zn uptake system ZnuABC Zn-binding protein ZnuA